MFTWQQVVFTQSEQSSLPQNTQTPKATWVQANQSVIPLYENQREINGSYINNGEIIFPQESDYPHKTELDTEQEAIIARLTKEFELCGDYGPNKDLYHLLGHCSKAREQA